MPYYGLKKQNFRSLSKILPCMSSDPMCFMVIIQLVNFGYLEVNLSFQWMDIPNHISRALLLGFAAKK